MAETIRIGAIYSTLPSNTSATEQLLGVRLAGEHTRRAWSTDARALEILEREVSPDPARAEEAGRDLAIAERCSALISMSTIPVAVRLAQWCEGAARLFMAAHNNPVVRQGRRRAFGIGVPSEVTGEATARFLMEGLGAMRVFLIHQPGEFQSYAAQRAADAMGRRGVLVERGELGRTPPRTRR